MISFNEACDQVGYVRNVLAPTTIYKYFAYKSGKAREFATMSEALTFSKNVEKVVTNQDEIDTFWKKRREGEKAAVDLWMAQLREEYFDLSGKQFDIIHTKAYESGHAYGYDEVALHFNDLYNVCIEFAKAGE